MKNSKKMMFAFCALGAAALASAFIILNSRKKREKADSRIKRINNLLEEADDLIKKYR